MSWKEFDVGPVMVYKNIEDIPDFNKKNPKQRLEQYIEIVKEISDITKPQKVSLIQRSADWVGEYPKIVAEKNGETVFLEIGYTKAKNKCPLSTLEESLQEIDEITSLKDISPGSMFYDRGFILLYGDKEKSVWDQADLWVFKKPGKIFSRKTIGLVVEELSKSSYQQLVQGLKKPYMIKQ